MPAASLAACLGRAWFSILVLVSALLVILTFLAFALGDVANLSRLLFWFGLAGENNVGAWWSGMLLLLAAVFAFDGWAVSERAAERKGWLALAAVLLILSFDEVASLHEHLANSGALHLAALAVPLFVLACYSLLQLVRSRIRLRTLSLIVLAFGLLGTVPLQEIVQHSREWPNPVIYGLRGALEEGIELAAILLLVAVASRNTRAMLDRPGDGAFAFTRHRAVVLAAAVSLAPILIAATFVLPYPGGPADWLAAACYLACALLVVKHMLGKQDAADSHLLALLGFYLAASVGSNAIKLAWDPAVLGTRIGLRGLFVAMLLVGAVPILKGAGRRPRPLLLGAAAAVALVGSVRPHAQLLWCGLPVLVALVFYSVESGLAAEARLAGDSRGIAMPGPAEG